MISQNCTPFPTSRVKRTQGTQCYPHNRMKRVSILSLLLLLSAITTVAQQPFLTDSQWTALKNESNGAAPYENLRYLTTLHRVPATPAFDQAAQFILERARDYGLTDVHAEQFPIDGTKRYGLMRSYFGWNVTGASLWQTKPEHLLLGDWATNPITLADYSRSADAETTLVDVGDGANERDYTGKDVRGKIVLADGVLARVQELAIGQHGAIGIVSDMPNQTTAWSGLDRTLIRWGHLEARQPSGFAFMVSRETADALRGQLRSGEVRLKAHVQAEVIPSHWTVITGTIPGTDSAAGEIVYSCHLDHERPGANDNGSGCVTILESARILAHLIKSGSLPAPKRTMRFIWGPEIEGTMAFLATHPDLRQRMRADIHMDMVGGDPFKNKSIFHVTATPWSLPSFVTDVGAFFLDAIKSAASDYAASGGSAEDGIVETRAGALGTRNELIADVTPFTEGSDHNDYDSSTIAVPSLYLRDWPDIYIHTDHDSLTQIDPTKLRRVALLGAASGYVYASVDAKLAPDILSYLGSQSQARFGQDSARAQNMSRNGNSSPEIAWYEAQNLINQSLARETAMLHAFALFANASADADSTYVAALDQQAKNYQAWIASSARTRGAKAAANPSANIADAHRIPVRVGEFGPLTYQNDNVLLARLGNDRYSKIKLVNTEATPLVSVLNQSDLYAYEIVNFVNGKRSVGEIRDAVSAEYGPISLEIVADYLEACVEAKIMQWK